jgi:hypothetical protein
MANLPDIGVAKKLNPRNINHIPPVQFFVRFPSLPSGFAETRDLEHICEDGHKLLPVHFWMDTIWFFLLQ